MISLLLGPASFWLARRVHLVDIPGSQPHKQHHGPMPLAGGLVIFLTVAVVGLAWQVLWSSEIWPILIPAALVFLFGLWDDARILRVFPKLAGQVLGALVLILLGVQVNLFHQQGLNWLLTVLWVVGITNAYNFVDSMDGLATGLAGLAAAFYMLVTLDSRQEDLSLLSAVLLGACIGSFYYNAPPARYFLGDSGAQFLGFTLAALAIAYNPVGFSRLQSWYMPALLAGVPIFDMSLVIFSRARRGNPIYRANVDHTYHRLVALGLDVNRAVLTMHLTALFLGCLAFIALSLPPLYSNLIFAACCLSGLALLLLLDSKRFWH